MLEALLRSIENKHQTFVIFKATTPDFRKGYTKLGLALKKDEHYIEETNLKQNLLDAMDTKQTCFMVDDDIIYKDFKFPEIKPIETYSLRLHKGISNPLHFNYAMSLDGNVFRTEDIRTIIKNLNFTNPNQLEAQLQGSFGHAFEMKYGKGHLIGFSHTRVSDGSHCHYTGMYSDEELNSRYLAGEIIDFEAMNIKPTDNVHTSMPYIFKTQ